MANSFKNFSATQDMSVYVTISGQSEGSPSTTILETQNRNPLTMTTFYVPDGVPEYLDINDIEIKGKDSSNNWSNLTIASRDAAAKTVTLSATPTSQSKTEIRILRHTQTTPLVDFVDGARLTESDLDKAYRQGLFVAQETGEDAQILGTALNQVTDLTLGGTTTVTNLTASGTVSLPNGSISNDELAGSIASGKLAGGITNAQLAGSIDLTSKVTGVLPIANGGTGYTTLPKWWAAGNANQNVANSTNDAFETYVFAAETVDTANGYNTSTGKYTAPQTGYYYTNAKILIQGLNANATYYTDIAIFVNNAQILREAENKNYYARAQTLSVSGIVYATQGQDIDVRIRFENVANQVVYEATTTAYFQGYLIP